MDAALIDGSMQKIDVIPNLSQIVGKSEVAIALKCGYPDLTTRAEHPQRDRPLALHNARVAYVRTCPASVRCPRRGCPVSAAFSQGLKAKILAALTAEQVYGGYMQLRKEGSYLVALCIFHSERTGSFKVNPRNLRFQCWGCGKAHPAASRSETSPVKFLPVDVGNRPHRLARLLYTSRGCSTASERQVSDAAQGPAWLCFSKGKKT
jgi:CHC2 zinc finger